VRISRSFRDSRFGLLRSLGLLLGYLVTVVTVQNHTSYSSSVTRFPIRAVKFCAYLASFSRSHFGLFWSLGLLLGYLASSGTKPDITFLLGDPDFLKGRRNFARISHRFRDPHFGLLGGLGPLLWHLARFATKFHAIFLLGDPNFLYAWRNFVHKGKVKNHRENLTQPFS